MWYRRGAEAGDHRAMWTLANWRLELLRTPGDDPRDLGFAEVLAELEMRLHDLYD